MFPAGFQDGLLPTQYFCTMYANLISRAPFGLDYFNYLIFNLYFTAYSARMFCVVYGSCQNEKKTDGAGVGFFKLENSGRSLKPIFTRYRSDAPRIKNECPLKKFQ